MNARTLAAGALAATLGLAWIGTASAQDAKETDAPATVPAPKPAADTKEPGKTATDAITHPSAVPPSEGKPGTGAPPNTGGAAAPAQ